MSQKKLLNILQSDHVRSYLLNAGIVHLWLFGSYARNEESKESDIDLLYQYDDSKHNVWSWGPFGVFEYLKRLLWKDIDLVNKDCIDESITKSVLSSTTKIF